MPEYEWTSQADFEVGTLNQLVATGGALAIDTGYNVGTWTSEWYQAPSWDEWRMFTVAGTRPVGTIIQFRFRSATTADGGATWSKWLDGVDSGGDIIFDLDAFIQDPDNAFMVEGGYVQFEIKLKGE